MNKKCSKCQHTKPTTNFGFDKSRKDNLHPYCLQCKRELSKSYRVSNPDNNAIYYQANRNKIIKRTIAYESRKRASDPTFRILKNCRRRISHALVDGYKSANTIELIGCSVEQLKTHLQSQFQSGMTWENYGQWHVDHIKPCVSFNLNDPNQQRACFHYSNLQPLWAKDNLSKGSN
jgi:hypothetical protein